VAGLSAAGSKYVVRVTRLAVLDMACAGYTLHPPAFASGSAQLERLSPEANSDDDHGLVTTHIGGRVYLPAIGR
jgi:hypothetical protein